jgi:hypothetical protein
MRRFWIGFSGLFIIALMQSSATLGQTDKQVWVFYLSFWRGDSWVASQDVLTDTPIQTYDTASASTWNQQIQQAQNTGIDAFIVSWFGLQDDHSTQALTTALNQAANRRFKIGVALDLFPGNVPKDQASITVSLNYIINSLSTYSAYLRFDGKPVIYFAFQQTTGFNRATWQAIRNSVDPNYQTIWVAEGLNGCCIYGGAFDGMYAFNLAWGDPASTATRQFASMRNAGGYFYTPTVHPGWDESLVAARDNRPNPTSPRDRANGQFLINSWNGAIASNASIILIVSWNEYMEGSHIEPSTLYGSQALDTLRPLIRDWKAGIVAPVAASNSPAQSAPSANVEPVAAGTRLTIAVQSMNVRQAPDSSSTIVASAFQGQVYDILGKSGNWYLIAVAGVQGYVLGDYVTLGQ